MMGEVTVAERFSVAWIAERVECAMTALDAPLAAELARLLSEVTYLQNDLVLVFDLHAWMAFDRFPVTVYTYDRQLRGIDSPIDGRGLLAGRTLLDPQDRYPIGWDDVAGANFTEDALVVERTVMKHLCQQWARVGATLPGYIGCVHGDDDSSQIRHLTSLSTGEVEAVTLR
jgi:hypothetical protein